MRPPFLFFLFAASIPIASGVGCGGTENASLQILRSAEAATPNEEPGPSVEFLDDLERARQEAQGSDKPILLFFCADACVYCSQMEEESFRDGRVVLLSEHFVCARIEASADPAACAEFHVRAYPTVQFLSSRGAPLNRLEGKIEAESLASQMEATLRVRHTRIAFRDGPPVH